MTGSSIGLIALFVFCAGMLHACVTDLARGLIRNWLVAGLAVAWAPLALTAGIPADEMVTALGAAALVFAAGFFCFVAGWMGGGDVKLATVAVLWIGGGQAIDFVLLASVVGALLTMLVVAARSIEIRARIGAPGTAPAIAEGVPYGPALAVAGLALLHGSPWAVAL